MILKINNHINLKHQDELLKKKQKEDQEEKQEEDQEKD